jgi:hypothetical protein
VKWLFFYPGDLLFQGAMSHAPSLARFLELTPSSFGGWGSGIISLFAWSVLSLVVTVTNAAREVHGAGVGRKDPGQAEARAGE